MEIREIKYSDYNLGYLNLIKQLSKFETNISYLEFCNYIDLHKNYKIFVMIQDNSIVGCGSFFILEKIHTNPIGQIEDVVIDENFRGLGLGKKIIDYILEYGLNKTNCYKIVLNCSVTNLGFYEKCGFDDVGHQCKFHIKT
jgi:glucosamine-phosphate N-acetyltransferase